MPAIPAPTMMTSKRSLGAFSVEPMVPLSVKMSCPLVWAMYLILVLTAHRSRLSSVAEMVTGD